MRRILVALLFVACSGQGGATAAHTPPPAPLIDAHTYVAIGASETLGLGSRDPEAQAWTSVLYRTALPQSALFYNLGEIGATTEGALRDELPVALGLHPDLVTVWLNVDDLVHGVSADRYSVELDRLLSLLTGAGVARVLVASTPVLSDLPAYRACLPEPPAGLPACAFRAGPVPAPAELDRLVGAYNSVIAATVARYHDQLVDLHCQGATAAEHPTWVSGDGFHPSAEGYEQIAHAFAAALKGTACYRQA